MSLSVYPIFKDGNFQQTFEINRYEIAKHTEFTDEIK